MWKLSLNLASKMPNRSLDGIRSVVLRARLIPDNDNFEAEAAELMLLPPATSNKYQPQLQVTTSTRRPMIGGSIILHVRSNFVLEDFHCVVTSGGRLLTTRLISMGNTKLKTFDELVSYNMAPEATFLIWHVDSWGNLVSASLTVSVFSHDRGHLDAHPVMEGSSG